MLVVAPEQVVLLEAEQKRLDAAKQKQLEMERLLLSDIQEFGEPRS